MFETEVLYISNSSLEDKILDLKVRNFTLKKLIEKITNELPKRKKMYDELLSKKEENDILLERRKHMEDLFDHICTEHTNLMEIFYS